MNRKQIRDLLSGIAFGLLTAVILSLASLGAATLAFAPHMQCTFKQEGRS